MRPARGRPIAMHLPWDCRAITTPHGVNVATNPFACLRTGSIPRRCASANTRSSRAYAELVPCPLAIKNLAYSTRVRATHGSAPMLSFIASARSKWRSASCSRSKEA